MYFFWFLNSSSLFLRFWNQLVGYWNQKNYMKLYVLIQSVLLRCWTFGQSFLQCPCSLQPLQMFVLLGVLVNLKGLLQGLLKGLFELYLNFVFCRDWQRIFILETGIPKLKTGYFRDCEWGWLYKTGGGCFCFPLSDCPLFCLSIFFWALSESLAMGSCSYSCTIDHLTDDQSDNLISLFLFFSFVVIDVRLADISSILPLDIWCWNQTGHYYLSLLYRVRQVFYISLKEVPYFLSLHTFNFLLK